MSSGDLSNPRLVSLDQYRGYCVLGMFVVNFLGHINSTPSVLKHNNTHFSLADSIMPAFIMIAGYSFRLTFLKRLGGGQELQSLRSRYVWRSLGLICLSLMFFGFGNKFGNFEEISLSSFAATIAKVIKADMWEVLAIIGACQLILLPFIAWASSKRLGLFLSFAALHLVLSGLFNWEFVNGLPNWLDTFLGIEKKRAWDGGVFGLISWSEIMLIGTLLPDFVRGLAPKSSSSKLLGLGLVLMSVGYSASCLTRLWDIPTSQLNSTGEAVPSIDPSTADESTSSGEEKPISKVWPPLKRLYGKGVTELLAEPPLVQPPKPNMREPNYWAMDKRVVTQSFVFFSLGFAVALYGLFVMSCDANGIQWRVFKTFGENPLAAYLIHHLVEVSLLAFFPKNSPLYWGLLGMLLSILITYIFVRFLENRKLYLRL